jgi:hypothetical protein
MPAHHAESQRQAGRSTRRCLAGAGNRHGEPQHADQLLGRAGRADPRGLRRGPAQRRSFRPPARLLAGRRRELRTRQPVRPRRARESPRHDRFEQWRQADRLSIPRRYSIFDGEHSGLRKSTPGARRRSELLHDARRPGPGPDGHRGGPRSRGGRHPHDQRSRSRSVRAADLYAGRPTRLVRQAVGGRSGGGSERAVL